MRSPSSPKALKQELKADNWMMLCFGVARELGMTVQQLRNNITPEELIGWSCYFEILNEQQEEAMRKARRR